MASYRPQRRVLSLWLVDFATDRFRKLCHRQHLMEDYATPDNARLPIATTALGLSDDTITVLQKVFWRRAWDEVTADHIGGPGSTRVPMISVC
jgi:hypothetical protein